MSRPKNAVKWVGIDPHTLSESGRVHLGAPDPDGNRAARRLARRLGVSVKTEDGET